MREMVKVKVIESIEVERDIEVAEDELMTMADAARLLGVDHESVRGYVSRGVVTEVIDPRTTRRFARRVLRSEILALLEKRRSK